MAFANGHLIAKDTVYAIHFLIARDFPMITDADKSNAHTGSSVVEFVGITGGIGLIEIPGLKPIQFLKSNMPHQAAALRFIQPCLSMMYQEKSNQAAAEMIFRHAETAIPHAAEQAAKQKSFLIPFSMKGLFSPATAEMQNHIIQQASAETAEIFLLFQISLILIICLKI